MIKYGCPHCRQDRESPSDMAGFIVVCAQCNKPIKVPAISSPHSSTSLRKRTRTDRWACGQCGKKVRVSRSKPPKCEACHVRMEAAPSKKSASARRRKARADGMIRFRCKKCNKSLKAPREHSGKKAACTRCHRRARVPTPSRRKKHQPSEILQGKFFPAFIYFWSGE